MKCNKCNSNVPDGVAVCPFCGKKLKPSALELSSNKKKKTKPEKERAKRTPLFITKEDKEKEEAAKSKGVADLGDWFSGDNSYDENIFTNHKQALEESKKDEAKVDLLLGEEVKKDLTMPGLIAAHEDYGDDRGSVKGQQQEKEKVEEPTLDIDPENIPEIDNMFNENDGDSISEMFNKSEVVPPPPGNINGGGIYGPVNSQDRDNAKGWKGAGGQDVYDQPQTRIREVTREIVKERGKSSNATVGFMVILISLFLSGKGGMFLLNKWGLFQQQLFSEFLWPWINLIESGVLIVALWLMTIVTRPWSLKLLALFFALGATLVYGYYTYVNLFLNVGIGK